MSDSEEHEGPGYTREHTTTHSTPPQTDRVLSPRSDLSRGYYSLEPSYSGKHKLKM